VQARVGTQTASVTVAVIPDLVRLDVTEAYAQSDGKWAMDVSGQDTPAVVRAVTEPDTETAHRYLTWSGGQTDPAHPYDRRLVTLAALAGADHGLPVDVEINLS
jgi:hypothetical protein